MIPPASILMPITHPNTNTTMTQHNITRYTYETTSFQGWRLSICRKWNQFTRYFSDKQYGSEQAAFEAAVRMRDSIFAELKSSQEDPRTIFSRYKERDLPTSTSAA